MFYYLASGLHSIETKGRIIIGTTRNKEKERKMETQKMINEACSEEPRILEEIQVEELAIDGICGVY